MNFKTFFPKEFLFILWNETHSISTEAYNEGHTYRSLCLETRIIDRTQFMEKSSGYCNKKVEESLIIKFIPITFDEM